MTVCAIGIDTDPTIVYFLRACRLQGAAVEAINLRELAEEGDWRLPVGKADGGWIRSGDRTWDLDKIFAVYARPIDLTGEQPAGVLRGRWHGLMLGLRAWLDTTPAVVVNRPSGGQNNAAKPLHEAFLARAGLNVPPSLTSCDPDRLRDFAAAGRTVVKTLSGIRANAREVTAAELRRYRRSQGPVHLQRLIEGDDIRAHVIGRNVFAVRITSTAVDYRVAGSSATFTRCELPEDMTDTLVRVTAQMGLSMAGWDLKQDRSGAWWCLEANPMPGYSPYDDAVGGAISLALLNFLQSGASAAHSSLPRPRGGAPTDTPLVRLPVDRGGRQCASTHADSDRPRPSLEVDATTLIRACVPGARVCPCDSDAAVSHICATLMAERAWIDGRLSRPARWQGLMRREVMGHGTPSDSRRFRTGFDTIAEQANRWPDRAPTVDTLLEVHERLVGGGNIRAERIQVESGHLFPHPGFLPTLLADLFEQHRSRVAVYGPVRAASELHVDLLTIHAFADGNGRTARGMAAMELMRAGFRSTLFTAVEQHFLHRTRDYVDTLRAYETGRICRAACVFGIVAGMARRSRFARMLRMHQIREYGDLPDLFLKQLGPDDQAELDDQLTRLTAEERDDPGLPESTTLPIAGTRRSYRKE